MSLSLKELEELDRKYALDSKKKQEELDHDDYSEESSADLKKGKLSDHIRRLNS